MSLLIIRFPALRYLGILLAIHFLIPALAISQDEVRFSRDVLPILSDRCFHCHGPDENNREAGLRLDKRESATETRDGAAAIVAGDLDSSQIVERLETDDVDLRMPPADSHRKPLTAAETATIKRWIEEGAKWGKHWAFEPPVRSDLPNPKQHPVDYFIQRGLTGSRLKASDRADPETLLRRLTLDLTGLPPTIAEQTAFQNDRSPNRYEKAVDRLLASPHYGERMAWWWLDAARYADTDGYQGDQTRNNWPWRDWVIRSFNSNLPFDQFTIQQFAGDLLEDATQDQILATAFHRHHMTNGEGGRLPEESRIDYVIDRVNTTGTVWLGLTLGCTQCHSHKFDPISHQDYYQLFSFFNSIDEDGKAGGGAKPFLSYQSQLVSESIQLAEEALVRRQAELKLVREEAKKRFEPWLEMHIKKVSDFHPWHFVMPTEYSAVEGTVLKPDPSDASIIVATGPDPRQDDYRITFESNRLLKKGLSRITGLRLEIMPHPSHTDGKLSRGRNGEFILTDVKFQRRVAGRSQVDELEFNSAVADVERKVAGRNYGNVKDTLDDDPRNGWTTESHDSTQKHFAIFALKTPLDLQPDEKLTFVMLHRSTRGNANIGRFRLAVSDQAGQAVRSTSPMPMEKLVLELKKNSSSPEKKLTDELFNQFLYDDLAYQAAKKRNDLASKQLSRMKSSGKPQRVMVLKESSIPRVSHVLKRGVWDQKGKVVQRGFPNEIFSYPKSDGELSRLDLAKWIVSRKNPLTARVIVNQLWQICFGKGIVRTPDDFGLQGKFPTHPDLLDWLAVELMESGWDIKHVLKLIVSSKTYQQSSSVNANFLELDPDNLLLARQNRFRLPSWMIRDASLQSSGLMTDFVGGPPTLPYQPPGVWAEMFMGRFRYEPSEGRLQFRRSLYAFWRRSAAPTFLFDSSQRRVCEVAPRRTNTPLHALVLLNNQTGLEAARALAVQALHRVDQDNKDQVRLKIDFLYRSVLARSPVEAEIRTIREIHSKLSESNKRNPASAATFLRFGQVENFIQTDHATIATWTQLASMIMNTDEAVTRE